MRRLRKHGLACFAWWFASFWLWLLLVGQRDRLDIVAAALAAAVAAVLAETARALAAFGLRIPARWLFRAWTVPLVVCADFAILMWALVRSALTREIVRGGFVTREFPARGRDPEARGIRAWAALVATCSPNAYVIEIEPERARVLLHDLVQWRTSESPV